MVDLLNKKVLKVIDANMLYLIGAILFWTVGYYFQGKNLLSGLIITQYIIILLPPIIYIKLKKNNIKETLRLNKISLKHGILVGLITILTYPVALFANLLLMTLMSLVGNLNIPELPTATSGSEYVILMFIISISAGICEEVFFRGFILSGYERIGKRKAIILSAILFGIFHFNLYNLMGPIVLGLVFGYLVIETNSIFAGMIGHIVNNGFAVTLGFLLNVLTESIPDFGATNEAASAVPTSVVMLSNTILFGIISVVSLLIAYKLINIIKKDMKKLNHKKDTKIYDKDTKVKRFEFLPLILPGILFVIMSIIQIKEIISLG